MGRRDFKGKGGVDYVEMIIERAISASPITKITKEGGQV